MGTRRPASSPCLTAVAWQEHPPDMALDMAGHAFAVLGELRVHPTAKWIRAAVGDVTIVDTCSAILVWEPRRIVPSYAVRREDLQGSLEPAQSDSDVEHAVSVGDGPLVLDPGTAFSVHTSAGTAFDVVTAQGRLPAAAFAPDDPALAGYVLLDFDAFDTWHEEDELLVAHARDPFKTVDTRRSSRRVVVERDGVQLADSRAPVLLFETYLPVRFYLPREDVRMELLIDTDTSTACAYKGWASYFSANVAGSVVRDLAWTYLEPHSYATAVRGMVSFFNERVDLIVDGRTLERPRTPWS